QRYRQHACSQRVQCAGVPGLLLPGDAPHPLHHVMRRHTLRLVYVENTTQHSAPRTSSQALMKRVSASGPVVGMVAPAAWGWPPPPKRRAMAATSTPGLLLKDTRVVPSSRSLSTA